MIGVSAHDGNYNSYGDTWVWWLEHGFDGIGAGLLAVAGLALTLAIDRRSRRRQHDKELIAAQREVVNRVLEKAVDLREVVNSDAGRFPDLKAAMVALNRETKLVSVELARIDLLGPELVILATQANVSARELSGRDLVDAGRHIASAVPLRIQEWLKDPPRYDPRVVDRIEIAAFGKTVVDLMTVATGFGPAPSIESDEAETPGS